MQGFTLRPTFEIPLAESRTDAIAKLSIEFSKALDSKANEPGSFLMHGEYGELHLPVAEHRLWSPHLSFYICERNQGGLLRGRFAPRIEIWTLVWVFYLALAFTAFFGLIFAYSQWMLREPTWGHWIAVLALGLILLLYLTANVGQQLSSDQMAALRTRLDKILEDAKVTAEISGGPSA